MSLFLMQKTARARPIRPNRNRVVHSECLNLRHGSEVTSISLSVFRIHGPGVRATHNRPKDRTDPKGPRPGQLSMQKLQSKLIDWLDVPEPRGLIMHMPTWSESQSGTSIQRDTQFKRHCSSACVHAVYVIVASIVVDNRRIYRVHMSFGSVNKKGYK